MASAGSGVKSSAEVPSMGAAFANVRWLIAARIRDFQAMLEELGKVQAGLPRDALASDEPVGDDWAA
jgi:hypothetical protein